MNRSKGGGEGEENFNSSSSSEIKSTALFVIDDSLKAFESIELDFTSNLKYFKTNTVKAVK